MLTVQHLWPLPIKKIVQLKVHYNKRLIKNMFSRFVLHVLTWKVGKIRKFNFANNCFYLSNTENTVTTQWLSLNKNVTVVSRYITLDHDTYRGLTYRYCIDISPYHLIPNTNEYKSYGQIWLDNNNNNNIIII